MGGGCVLSKCAQISQLLQSSKPLLGPCWTSHDPISAFFLGKQKYPIVWQGLLALKNDTAAVQLHFVSGNNVLAHRSLPLSEGGPPLRIAQRMRLEASQLEGVARRMTVRLVGRVNAHTLHMEGGIGSHTHMDTHPSVV